METIEVQQKCGQIMCLDINSVTDVLRKMLVFSNLKLYPGINAPSFS